MAAGETFGVLLRAAMGSMTQEQLEELSGVSQATISALLNGKKKPSYDTLVALEKALPKLPGLRRHAAA